MRYLKIFEDFEDKLYTIVNPIGIADNRVAFNDYKLSKLSEECKKLSGKTYISLKSDLTRITNQSNKLNEKQKELIINEIETADEYFLNILEQKLKNGIL